jgi:acyl dehydratase
MQRTALQGSPDMLSAITGQWQKGAARPEAVRHPFTRCFEDLSIGDTHTTDAREVTLDDIEHFAAFTGDTFYAHMDEAAAQRNPFFPGRVAHGYLILSFAAGLFVQPDEGPVLANTGLENLRFLKPVPPGASIRVQLTVKRKTRRTDSYGEVRWNVEVVDQDGEAVAEYDLLTMVRYRDPAGRLTRKRYARAYMSCLPKLELCQRATCTYACGGRNPPVRTGRKINENDHDPQGRDGGGCGHACLRRLRQRGGPPGARPASFHHSRRRRRRLGRHRARHRRGADRKRARGKREPTRTCRAAAAARRSPT